MSRNGKEFSSSVIEYIFRKSGGCCELCGSQEKLEVHHLLPLWYASQYFPQIASWALKSAENAQCLCSDCHDEIHRNNDLVAFQAHAVILIAMMGELLL